MSNASDDEREFLRQVVAAVDRQTDPHWKLRQGLSRLSLSLPDLVTTERGVPISGITFGDERDQGR